MKRSLLLFSFFLILFLPQTTFCFPKKPDASVCLTVNGKVSNEGREECKIELLHNSDVQEIILLKKGKKKFSFSLKRNQHYIIRISQPGRQTKNICIHTSLPDTQTGNFEFDFETRLTELRENIEADPVNPVASIYYHEKKQCFYYHKSFSSYYQKQLCKEYTKS